MKTYEEVGKYLDYAASGKSNLTIFLGNPGIGKTHLVKEAFAKKKGVFFVSGYMTKTQFIKTLYEHRDDFIILDDTDNLFLDKSIFGILRSAFDTTNERRVDYYSPSPFVADIPQSFVITAPMLIITNGLDESTVMKAFKNRAVCIDFQPCAKELVKKLDSIIQAKHVEYDEEVFNYYSRVLTIAKNPSFRSYILTVELKKVGIDWQSHLDEALGANPLLAAAIRSTEHSGSFKARAAVFTKLTGMSERTYSRLLKQLRNKE